MSDFTTAEARTAQQSSSDREQEMSRIRQRLREESKQLKIREATGEYKFDNPDLEHKTKRQTKLVNLEEKYKDKPKIAFHQLSDEGNRLFMQAKRDKVWTTIGWSVIGNFAAIGVIQYIETNNTKWKSLRTLQRRESMKVFAFLGTVGLFTLYGYGNARQNFIKRKLLIVGEHSVSSSEQ